MHEREKSDPAIGAGKPTNKAEASAHAEHGVSDAAEPVEQRAGAKGNADEQSMHRTQGRERVSQALDRVRKAARLKKDEKFTALLHHINLDLLREAFYALKRDAAPGVDGVTWRAYEADLDLYAECTVMRSPRREDTAAAGFSSASLSITGLAFS